MLKYIDKHFSTIISSYKEVIPITFFTIIISIYAKATLIEIFYFIVSSIILIIGKAAFTVGAKTSLEPMGKNIGVGLIRNKKISLIIILIFIIGFILTIFENDLRLFGENITILPNYITIIFISIGIGIYLAIALLKSLYSLSIKKILTLSYVVVIILTVLIPKEYIALAFDSITTTMGPMFVPFITTLGLGLMTCRMDKYYKKDGFGALALCSAGHLIAALVIIMIIPKNNVYDFTRLIDNVYNANFNISTFTSSIKEILITSIPFIIILFMYQIKNKKITIERRIKLTLGLIISIIGLGLISASLALSFSNIGYKLGTHLSENKILLIITSMVYGLLIVRAEPAVNLLNEQIETITIGSINKNKLMLWISISVAIASLVAVLRIMYQIPIIWILLIGYALTIILSYFISETFTLVAFDAASVATGPISLTFLLPIMIGYCIKSGGNVLTTGFGLIALINLFPIISVEIYGLIYKYKSRILRTYNDYDDAIITYNWREND